jgi:hypothetical protein
MDEYVQYHHPEYAELPVERPGPFSIYTRKTPREIQGSRIWLVARKRDTREYYLVYWFIADNIIVPGEAGEPNTIEGKSGAWLRPIVRIDQLPWFDAFLKYMGNFGLGLQKIADPVLATALRAAADAERLADGASVSFAAEIKEALENVSVSPIQQAIVRELAKQPQSAPDLTSRLGLRLPASPNPGRVLLVTQHHGLGRGARAEPGDGETRASFAPHIGSAGQEAIDGGQLLDG